MRFTSNDAIVFEVPAAAASAAAGQAVVDLGALPPSPAAEAQIAAAQQTADDAQTDATAALAASTAAQEDATLAMTVTDTLPTSQVTWVRTAADFPAAVAGVRTLADNHLYFVVANVDLGTDRLQVNANVALFGTGAIQAQVRTNNASPLVTSGRRIVLRDVAIINQGGACVRVTGLSPADSGGILRADGCAFSGQSASGVIQAENLDLTTLTACRITTSSGVGLRLTGTCRTVFVGNSISQANAAGFKVVEIPAGASVLGRAICQNMASDLANGGVGIDADEAAFVPQGLTVSGCTFPARSVPGVGVPASGTTSDSAKAFFLGNSNLENSHVRAGLSIANNATPTTVSNTADYFPLAGTTTLQAAVLFDSPVAGRLRYIGTGDILAKVTAYVTLVTAAPSQDLEVLFALIDGEGNATNVTEFVQEDVTDGTTLRTGIMPLLAWIRMAPGEAVDVRVRNKTAANNVTWRHGQVYAEQING